MHTGAQRQSTENDRGESVATQTAAFEIEGDVIRAPYVVRNMDKLRIMSGPLRPAMLSLRLVLTPGMSLSRSLRRSC